MTPDARISTGLPDHPKTKKLIKRLGASAAWYLVRLFLWAAANRSDGDLSGMTDEDIELAIDWNGENGALVRELVAVAFLDGEEGARSIHDWLAHNPWAAGSKQRAEKSKWAALCRRYGRDEAARQMPDYARRIGPTTEDTATGGQPDATGTDSAATGRENPATGNQKGSGGTDLAVPDSASGTQKPHSGSAPSPIPIPIPTPTPIPTPIPNPTETLLGGEPPDGASADPPSGFERFWAAWPKSKRKEAKGKCLEYWHRKRLERQSETILAHLTALKATDWTKDGCQFVEAPLVYLRAEKWVGAALLDADGADPGGQAETPWYVRAGFENPWVANNERCYEHNAHQFRDGRRIVEEAST